MVVCRHCGTANQPGKIKCSKCLRDLIDPSMIGKIPCVNHANREATTSCNACASRLCDRCAYLLSEIAFCEGCAPEGAISHEHDEDYEAVPVVHVGSEDAPRASMGARALAFLIDSVLTLAFAGVLAVLLASFSGGTLYMSTYVYLSNVRQPMFWIFWLLLPAATLTYHTLTVGMSGQTVGKRVADIIVLEEDGTIITTQQALSRAVAQHFSLLFLGLGYLWALWDKNNETWHDKLSKTVTYRYQDTT
ncbi:RDD family protein [Armatimonas sp.]|uniref:RDD family protein n=1 Tax=Armatimonas sp. TaxID=1872638 RepID=UPI0037536B94